jgi:hypothetical protein
MTTKHHQILEHHEIMFPTDGSTAKIICRAYKVYVVATTMYVDAQKHPLTIGVGGTHVLSARPGCTE